VPHAEDSTPDLNPGTEQLPTEQLPTEQLPTVCSQPSTAALPVVPPAVPPAASPATRAASGRRRRTRLTAVVAATALAAGVGAGAFVSARKTITLDVHGEVTTVTTFAGSPEGVLRAHDIVLGEHDTVSIALDAPLRDGTEVVVRYASEVTVETDGEVETRWVAVLDADEALRELVSRGRDVRLVASRSGD
jgi:hypothetical protein